MTFTQKEGYEELEVILKVQARRYPKLQVMDAIKLIYQNEFGPGHLIEDAHRSLCWIKEEIEQNQDFSQDCYLEDIGNGLVRLNLQGFSLELAQDINAALIETACRVKGTKERLVQKLAVLDALTESNAMPFFKDELKEIKETYIKEGCLMARHSETYRQAYHPAYRILLKEQGANLCRKVLQSKSLSD